MKFLPVLLFLSFFLTDATAVQSETNFWHGQVREVRYRPDGDAFVGVNGTCRFSRAIYGTNTGFRLETSDFPEFGLYMPGLGGSLNLIVRNNEKQDWAKDMERVESRFVSGERTYLLRDRDLLGKGKVLVTVMALSDADGFIVKTSCIGVPKGVELIWVFGGASDKRFSRNGDIGADPADCFWITAAKCLGNRYELKNNAFRLTYGKEKQLEGIFPEGTRLRTADASQIGDLSGLLASEAGDKPLLLAIQPSGKGDRYLEMHAPASHVPLPTTELKDAFIKAGAFRASVAGRVKVQTPDVWLNPLGGILSGAEDAIWESPSYLHGAIGWRVPFTGWRGAYMGDVLGFHDKARMHFDGYAHSQVTQVPASLPPSQDPLCNLARAEKKWGTPMYSNGYISRFPGKTDDMNHYDMNLVYIDELLWHLNWTGDWTYARQIFPVIKRHLAWEKQAFDPDNDGLYDGYCCIWASDGLQYDGGAVTHSSAYNYRANRMAARIAEKLGENPEPYRQEAAKILTALNKELWIKDKGWWAEFRDNMGAKMRHEDAALWTIYHAIDSDVPDAFQAWEATRYVDLHIPHIPVLAKGLDDTTNQVVSTSDWQTYNWSINNVAFAEIAHTALAYWQAGRREEAMKLYKGAVLDAMYLGSGPGNVTQISFYDAARGECYRDFADPAAMAARALVQGLFGIQPDLLDSRLLIRPGFPASWDRASLKTKDIRFEFDRNRNIDHYVIEPDLPVSGTLTLQLAARSDEVRRVLVNGRDMSWKNRSESVGTPEIVLEAGQAGLYDITVIWGGKPVKDSLVLHSVQRGERLNLDVAKSLSAIYDPEGVLEDLQENKEECHGRVKASAGHHTVFVRQQQGKLTWWKPMDVIVTEPIKAKAAMPETKGGWFEKVDLAPHFNDRVRDIWAYGKYLTPRWPYTTLNVPSQGMGEWTHPEDLYSIDDRGLRQKAGAAGEIRMPGDIPFATPGDSTARNVVFTTLWDNYPDSVCIPLSGRASEVHLLLAASTYHMQCHVLNGTITVRYADGTSDVLDLILPETLLPLDQDIYEDGYAFRLNAPRPWRLRLKTGEITRTPAADLHLKQGNGPLVVDGGLATMMTLPLQANKQLKSLEIKTVANEVIIGLLSATLRRTASIDTASLPEFTLPVRTHDPVMIRQGDTYYLYATGMGIEMQSSKDLQHWKRIGRVFPEGRLPVWFKDFIPEQNGHLWAPDIQYRDGLYHLYYSVSAWMNFNSSIGYATNTTLDPSDPAYRWVDHGCVISYKNGGEGVNVIDPNVFTDKDGKVWLLYGSYKAGLRLVELDRKTGLLKNPSKPELTVITTSLGEGSFLVHSGGWYYIFASRGRCCAGMNSTYQVVVGRSRKLKGPYLTKEGKSWVDNDYTVFLAGDEAQPGKGHNGFLLEEGITQMVYHAYTRAADGASLLAIRPVYVGVDGWPTLVRTNTPFVCDCWK